MRILVVGDAILDEFILCEPGTSSAGEPILIERERVYRPGGAAGVARVVESLGTQAKLCAPAGDDEEGWRLSRLLRHIVAGVGEPTTTTRKTRIRCEGRDEVRIDRDGTARKYALPVHDDILHADAVILADYGKGALDVQERQRIIRLCRECVVPCVVGAARGVAWSEYAGATYISATQAEAWAANYPTRATDAFYCLTADRLGLRLVRGAESHHSRYEVAEVDSLGCGDSVVAALAVGLAERMPLDALSRFAAAVGAIQATKGPGVQPVSRAEVEAMLGAATVGEGGRASLGRFGGDRSPACARFFAKLEGGVNGRLREP